MEHFLVESLNVVCEWPREDQGSQAGGKEKADAKEIWFQNVHTPPSRI
jgi:hypothetical protein